MITIKHLIKIGCSPQNVYAALTTPTVIRSWWTDNADLDDQAGGWGTFRFHYGETLATKVKIINLQPDFLVSWSVVESFRPEQNGTLIIFELRSEGNGTLLYFSQGEYAEQDDTYALMNTGWAYYLVSLKQYLETGKGAPSPNVDFGILLR